MKKILIIVTLAVAPLPAAQARPDKPIRALLVIGGNYHDYARQKDILPKGISERADVQWTVAYDPDKADDHKHSVYDNPDWAKGFDVVVHDECSVHVKDQDAIGGILAPHRKGVPAVILHCGMHSYRSQGFPQDTPWFELTGLKTSGHGAQLPIEITFVDHASVITKTLGSWTTVNEELYNNLTGKLEGTASALARGKQAGKNKDGSDSVSDVVVAWTNTYNKKTRVFATTLGHNNDTAADPRYLDLVARGLLWSVGKLDKAHLKPAKQVFIDGSPAGSETK